MRVKLSHPFCTTLYAKDGAGMHPAWKLGLAPQEKGHGPQQRLELHIYVHEDGLRRASDGDLVVVWVLKIEVDVVGTRNVAVIPT